MPVIKQLPTQVFHAEAGLIRHINDFEAILRIAFGIAIRKTVNIEGVNRHIVAPKLHSAAKHAMIILLGGKPLLIHCDPTVTDGIIRGRVFLNRRVYDAPDGTMFAPYGLDTPLLEVGSFFQWLHHRDFDVAAIKQVLNGGRRREQP